MPLIENVNLRLLVPPSGENFRKVLHPTLAAASVFIAASTQQSMRYLWLDTHKANRFAPRLNLRDAGMMVKINPLNKPDESLATPRYENILKLQSDAGFAGAVPVLGQLATRPRDPRNMDCHRLDEQRPLSPVCYVIGRWQGFECRGHRQRQ